MSSRPVETETHWRIAPVNGISEGGTDVFLAYDVTQDALTWSFDFTPYAGGFDSLAIRYFDGTSYGDPLTPGDVQHVFFTSIAVFVEWIDASTLDAVVFDQQLTAGPDSGYATTEWTFGADYRGSPYFDTTPSAGLYPRPLAGYNTLRETTDGIISLRAFLPSPYELDLSQDWGSDFLVTAVGSNWYLDDGGLYFGTESAWSFGAPAQVREFFLYGVQGALFEPPLRLFQRDDAQGIIKSPRIGGHSPSHNNPASQQQNPAHRLRQGGNTYV